MTEYQRRLKVERDNFSIGEAYKLEGKLEGRLEGKIEVASKLKAEGMAITKIAQITGLSVSKINDL
ncbi:hypothetical protein [Pedobacter metabolipauper]|uniref:hypothetical protein n=1 Tax=Pedobacter metabolipauper TaxID=425513 RepID=UPI001060B8A8|nr:hypothetical protein [Pedobacter metabolipauper]